MRSGPTPGIVVDGVEGYTVGARGSEWHGLEEGNEFEEPRSLREAIKDEGDADGKAEPEDEGGGEEVSSSIVGQELQEPSQESG